MSDFLNHPFIQSIANNERWTISTRDKMPIDMYELIYRHNLTGALYHDRDSLVDLTTLERFLPGCNNKAYYLSMFEDGFVVLDIEPKCPDNIKKKLLELPYLYGEISMSGKGYHMVFPLPNCIANYPAASRKIVMKEEHGWYEILMVHYVTFTGNLLPPSRTNDNSFETLFEEMASNQKIVVRSDISVEANEPENIPMMEKIIEILQSQLKLNFKKKPSDYNDDYSRYEYATVGFLNRKLNNILNTKAAQAQNHNWTPQERAWLIYLTAKEELPYREKHDETRDGLPWLLYLAREFIAKSENDKS